MAVDMCAAQGYWSWRACLLLFARPSVPPRVVNQDPDTHRWQVARLESYLKPTEAGTAAFCFQGVLRGRVRTAMHNVPRAS